MTDIAKIARRIWQRSANGDIPNWQALAAAIDADVKAQGWMVVQGWQPIESAPPVGTIAILYSPSEASDFEGLDYRYSLAIFGETAFGKNWHEQGTNHLVSEREDLGLAMPTHYLPLPASPLAGGE